MVGILQLQPTFINNLRLFDMYVFIAIPGKKTNQQQHVHTLVEDLASPMASSSLSSSTTTAPKSPRNESLWSVLLQRMHPRTCLSGLDFDDPSMDHQCLEEVMPSILQDIDGDNLAKRKKALQNLYELSDVNHKHNRYV